MTPAMLEFGGVKVYQNPLVPLDRAATDAEGNVLPDEPRVPVLYVMIQGEMHVHPDRWSSLADLIKRAGGTVP